ncbi:fatty acid desaturase [Pelagibius sp. CAU 1746]|uniref:fatty acid desaturase n=1 Tax=Pelagibius sp. CAU 1746 TaxID=3140370 RepID=UPI00325BE68A
MLEEGSVAREFVRKPVSSLKVSSERPPATAARHLPRRLEAPTLLVALAIYGGFGALTWFHAALPWWVLLPLGAYLVAWHGSLQHEVTHGHPTPSALANELLVLPSLWLWVPFRRYRDSHLAHHDDAHLTDPLEDPESYYLDAANWAAAGPLTRTFLRVHNTLAGRLLFGPLRCVVLFWKGEIARALGGDFGHAKAWAIHAAGVALVLAWVVGVCGLPLWQYLLFFVYPGISLSLLRSFLEHQARPEVTERSVIIEAGPLMSLLFLNNNLHLVHHDKPGLAWYRIPALYRQRRALFLASNGGYFFKGYGEVFRRYFLRAKEQPLHPAAA